MPVILGPYPLCPMCRETNGGLIAVRHRQVHLRAHGQQACVDRGLAGLLACLWAVSETRSCCEDDGGRAYVVPTAQTCDAAAALLTTLGLSPSIVNGTIYFTVPTTYLLHDADFVRQLLQHPPHPQKRWRVNNSGAFEELGHEPGTA